MFSAVPVAVAEAPNAKVMACRFFQLQELVAKPIGTRLSSAPVGHPLHPSLESGMSLSVYLRKTALALTDYVEVWHVSNEGFVELRKSDRNMSVLQLRGRVDIQAGFREFTRLLVF